MFFENMCFTHSPQTSPLGSTTTTTTTTTTPPPPPPPPPAAAAAAAAAAAPLCGAARSTPAPLSGTPGPGMREVRGERNCLHLSICA